MSSLSIVHHAWMQLHLLHMILWPFVFMYANAFSLEMCIDLQCRHQFNELITLSWSYYIWSKEIWIVTRPIIRKDITTARLMVLDYDNRKMRTLMIEITLTAENERRRSFQKREKILVGRKVLNLLGLHDYFEHENWDTCFCWFLV